MTKLDQKECTKTTPVNSLILFIYYDKEYRLTEDSVFQLHYSDNFKPLGLFWLVRLLASHRSRHQRPDNTITP